jgi:hypothetical protein
VTARDELLAAADSVEAAIDAGDLRRIQKRLRDLRALIVLRLPSEPGFVCDVCSIRRPTREALADHRSLVHGLEDESPIGD